LSWSSPFYEPVPLADGGQFVTLEDAATYIQKLPKAEQDTLAWQFAVEMLTNAADSGWPLMMAHIAILRALGHGKIVVKQPRGGKRRIGASGS
jgi:hypothetical protein